MDLSHCDGIDDLDGDDLPFERFAGVLWTLAVFYAIQILGERLEIGLTGGVSEQQGSGVEGAAEEVDVAFVNTFEVGIGEDADDVCGIWCCNFSCALCW